MEEDLKRGWEAEMEVKHQQEEEGRKGVELHLGYRNYRAVRFCWVVYIQQMDCHSSGFPPHCCQTAENLASLIKIYSPRESLLFMYSRYWYLFKNLVCSAIISTHARTVRICSQNLNWNCFPSWNWLRTKRNSCPQTWQQCSITKRNSLPRTWQ